MYENVLFIFRRDLRVIDNVGLNLANKLSKNIYPIFIFTPEQVTKQNKFKSDYAVQFMIESLQDLSVKIDKMDGRLLFFYGKNNDIITDLIKKLKIQAVFFNVDYSPYAIERDSGIAALCKKMNVAVEYGHDYYLHQPGTILNMSGETYQKFTPFYQTALKTRVDPPARAHNIHFAKSMVHNISLDEASRNFINTDQHGMFYGGRTKALQQIKTALKDIHAYSVRRNDLSQTTSQLSPYIKFGCVSIREIYHAFKSKPEFTRQLYWRDFYANILFSYPHVLGHSMKPKYDKIQWNHNPLWFKKWCDGKTGFPVVDAGMRQLNQTGYMHNRARMIVMSFLIKTLLLDWRLGEKYFATKLTDYDPASNNGNIQWVMGGGSDSNPYFRIFNSWRQTEEYDPDAKYIQTWIPELREVPVKDILNWETSWSKYSVGYPRPMVNYNEQKEKALTLYKNALQS